MPNKSTSRQSLSDVDGIYFKDIASFSQEYLDRVYLVIAREMKYAIAFFGIDYMPSHLPFDIRFHLKKIFKIDNDELVDQFVRRFRREVINCQQPKSEKFLSITILSDE